MFPSEDNPGRLSINKKPSSFPERIRLNTLGVCILRPFLAYIIGRSTADAYGRTPLGKPVAVSPGFRAYDKSSFERMFGASPVDLIAQESTRESV